MRLLLIMSLWVFVGCSSDAGVAGPTDDASTSDAPSAPDTAGLPCDVTNLLLAQCSSCHGATPIDGAPMSLVTHGDLVRPSISNPSVSMAQLAVARMQSTTMPMPPAPNAMPSAADIAVLQAWIDGGMPAGTCDMPNDPYGTPETCSSGTQWTRGDRGSELMHPGGTCLACHVARGEGPRPVLRLGGTVYASAHEPDDCNGEAAASSDAITVVVTDANGTVVTMTPNAAGNFDSQTPVTFPITAVVRAGGRVRAMATPAANGDCNGCHTEAGAMGAPGRIMAP